MKIRVELLTKRAREQTVFIGLTQNLTSEDLHMYDSYAQVSSPSIHICV